MSKIDFDSIRNEFVSGKLDEGDIPADPFVLFEDWMKQAISEVRENANAMVLSTVSPAGRPSSRVVLLKDVKPEGFVFFTSYNSRKGRELSENPHASLLFYWDALHRQVRIEGEVSKVPENVSEDYFNSRPLNSRVSAMISPQSEIVPGRHFLENSFDKALKSGQPKRPESWGGYILKPDYFEFWQGREGRLHDRLTYTSIRENWNVSRLAP